MYQKTRQGGTEAERRSLLRKTEVDNRSRGPLAWLQTGERSYNSPVDIYEEITRLRREGRRGALATIVNVRGSIPSFETAKMLVRDDGSIAGTIGGGCVEAEVWEAAREVMKLEKPQTLKFNLNNNPKYDTGLVCGGTLEVFVEPVLPVSTLYIFGAGHVAWSLYKVARLSGFDVVVTDDRETYANRERFPEARDIYVDEYERVTAQLAPGESSYIVIVTRGHRDDMRVLRWAAETPARYIGMIGSQRKTIAIYKELEKKASRRKSFPAFMRQWVSTSAPSRPRRLQSPS